MIDLFGLSEGEALQRFPNFVQVAMDRVRPERLENNRDTHRKNCWIFGEPRRELRPALSDLGRFIATVQTSKHAVFQFLLERILPDATLIALCKNDAWLLSVVSSRVHVAWALSAGGWLEVGNDPRYHHSRYFNPFPFPNPAEAQKARLRSLGEQLDAHRKTRQRPTPS